MRTIFASIESPTDVATTFSRSMGAPKEVLVRFNGLAISS